MKQDPPEYFFLKLSLALLLRDFFLGKGHSSLFLFLTLFFYILEPYTKIPFRTGESMSFFCKVEKGEKGRNDCRIAVCRQISFRTEFVEV